MIMNLFANPYRGATSAKAEEHEQKLLADCFSKMSEDSLDAVIISAQQYGEFDSQKLRYALTEKEERKHGAEIA